MKESEKEREKVKFLQAEADSNGLFCDDLIVLHNKKFFNLKCIVGPPLLTLVNLNNILFSVCENIHKCVTPKCGATPIKSLILLFFLSFKFIAVCGPKH